MRVRPRLGSPPCKQHGSSHDSTSAIPSRTPNLLAEAWIAVGRLQRRRARGRPHVWDARHAWIERNVPGRSFADVGGVYSVDGDVALAAERAGAAPVSLFDAGDIDLSEFPRKASEAGSAVRYVQGDLEEAESVRALGPHDVVYCTGVIYHTPNPILQLMHLREITSELLYLGSRTVPEVPGLRGACVLYPGIDEDTRAALVRAEGGRREGLGLGLPFDERPMHGYGNFWWGITRSALEAMLRTANFEPVEWPEVREAPFFTDVVARPIDRAPLLPPRSHYRERGEALARGEDRLPFTEHYEQHGRGWL
jgi:hypothetical protein